MDQQHPALHVSFEKKRGHRPAIVILPFGARDASNRVRVTKTPPFSTMSRLCRKAKNV
jgi:hypothetical protein